MIAVFLDALERLFGWLLTASWQASVLALLVLLLQMTLRGWLNPRWRYALWLLVVARLVLPVLPESALSLFQAAPQPSPALIAPVMEPILAPPSTPPVFDAGAPLPEPGRPFTFYSLFAVIWLAGAAILLILTWQVNRRFVRQVGNSPEITDPDLLKLFAEAKIELGVTRSLRLIESRQIESPAIMGLFYPTLLLPSNVHEKFDASELRLIFLHELAHLKRGDVIVQGMIALLQILHWFNPVLWFAFRRMRADRELATDALVLSRTGEAEKERYGLMLIKLLEHFHQRHSLPTLVGILEDKDQFKRRFSLIAKFTRDAYGWSMLGVLLIGILSVACLTKGKASQPAIDVPDFFAGYPAASLAPGEPQIQINLTDKYGSGSSDFAPARAFARAGGSSESRRGGVLTNTTDSDYVVDKDVKFIKARYIIHSADSRLIRTSADLPITSIDAIKSIPVGNGFSATAVLLEPTKLIAPVPVKTDQTPGFSYDYNMRVLTIPAHLRDRFQALQKSGRPLDILKEPGVNFPVPFGGGGLFPDQPPQWFHNDEINFLIQASSSTPDLIYLKGSFDSTAYDSSFHLGDHFQVFAVGNPRKIAINGPSASFFDVLLVRAEETKPGVPMRKLPEY